MSTLGIYGTGGSGRELLEMVERFPELRGRWDDVVFIDDVKPAGEFRGRRMMPLDAFGAAFAGTGAEVVVAAGEPYYRMLMADKVRALGFRLATVLHPMAHVSPSAKIGDGVVVRVGSVISADAVVEDNVWIQTYATIGHDAVVGANSQVSSYVMAAGGVKIGRNVYLGISAAVREEVVVGDEAIVSMGAIVMRDVAPLQVVQGNPAEPVMVNASRRVFKSARNASNAATRRFVGAEAARADLPEVDPALLRRVRDLLAAKLPGVDFSRSDRMADDGYLDSVSMLKAITSLKAAFGIEIPYDRITPESFNNPASIAALVAACQGGGARETDLKGTWAAGFLATAASRPGALCLGCGDVRLTYGEVRDRVLNCAAALRDRLGVAAGDKVMLAAVAGPDYVVALLAAQVLGAVTAPFDRHLKEASLAPLVAYLRPKAVLAAEDLAGLARDGSPAAVPELPARAADEVCEILFTTGTTGTPKGAMLSHGAVREIIRHTWKGVGMRADDTVLIPLPLNHSVGMRVLRTALSIGAAVVVQDGLAFARTTERNLVDFACTGMVCVPTAADLLLEQMGARFAEVMGRLRYLEFGAGSVPVPMKRRLVAALPSVRLVNTWGSSETGGAIFLVFSDADARLDTLGRPVAGVEIGTLDADGKFGLARDAKSAGRMALRGGMRMSGYFELPEATASALQGDWLVTNDLAYVDEAGFVHMLGRADDIINTGGEKVAPVEVERVAQDHAGIRECACVGAPDAVLGAVPVLFYVPSEPGFDEVAYLRDLTGRLEPYQVPRLLVRLERLPRNAMAKLDRRALREQARALQETRA